jgi:D-glycero-alpha-D-manno-heptose-7-phosphate kinase
MANTIFFARAPLRIDFAGGWTDVPPYSMEIGGAVVNAAINKYTYIAVEHRMDGHYRLESADFGIALDVENRNDLVYNGELDVVKAAIKRSGNATGLNIFVRCDSPPGSGTGSSASICVALSGLLLKDTGTTIVDSARAIEIEELKIAGGKQDQYGLLYGGFNFIECKDPHVTRTSLKPAKDILCHLEKHLILCYTGKSRVSGNLIFQVMNNFIRGNPTTLKALNNILIAGREMKRVLEEGNLDEFGRLLSINWENQRLLDPSVSNERIDKLFQIAMKSGALGGKALGAGGGGCLIFYAGTNKEAAVRKAVREAGAEIIDFNFDHDGLTLWSSPGSYKKP